MKVIQNMTAKWLGACLIAAATFAAPAAKADFVVSFSTDQWFGDTNPGPTASVFATATFQNNGANHVTLTLDYFGIINGDDGGAKISEWSFNINNFANLTSISRIGGTAGPAATSLSQNHFKADGTGGFFDILIDFHTGGPLNHQAMGSTAVFDIIGNGIVETDFNALSSGGNPGRVGAIHVQSYGITNNNGSLWIGGGCVERCEPPEPPVGEPMPEPGTLTLLGIGIGALALRRRRH